MSEENLCALHENWGMHRTVCGIFTSKTTTERLVNCLFREKLSFISVVIDNLIKKLSSTAVMCTSLQSLTLVCLRNYYVRLKLKPDTVSRHTLLFIIVYAGEGKQPYSLWTSLPSG